MKTIYLAGHGEWTIKNEYAQVPPGCSISFYTEFSKNMFTSDMKEIIGGTFGGSVKSRIDEHKTCPNYTLHPDGASYQECTDILAARGDANLGLIMYPSGRSWTLKDIFDWLEQNKMSIEMHWCACRFTGLKDAGGKAIGVNAAQGTWGDRDNQGKLVPDGSNPDVDLYYFNPTTKTVKNLTSV